MIAAVLATVGLAPGPSSAEEVLPAPVLTPPSPDTHVGSEVELTATAESPFVVFELGPLTAVVRRTPVAADEDGIFRDTLPTAGLASRFGVHVRACADASLSSCTTRSAGVPLHRTVPRLVAIEAWPSAVLDPAKVDQVSFQVADLSGPAGVVSGAGVARRTVHEGDMVRIDVAALPDGTHGVDLTECNSLEGSVCSSSGRALVVRRALQLHVFGSDLFVSQNGDGLWETAAASFIVDPDVAVTARWRVVSSAGATAMGPYELTAEDLARARSGQGQVVVDPLARLGHPLAAGRYRFEVETTSTVPGFDKSARESLPLRVSNAPRVTALTPTTPGFYTWRDVPGVPDAIRFSPALDRDEVTLGAFGYRVRKQDGQLLGDPGMWFAVDPADPVVSWDGTTYHDGHPGTAPRGTYRIELIRHRYTADGPETVYGPVSAPFVLHRNLPPVVDARTGATARQSWRRTIVRRGAAIRMGRHGSLQLRRLHDSAGPGSVTTAHSMRLPAERLRGADVHVRLSGAWRRSSNVTVSVVTPAGRTVPVSVWRRSATGVTFAVPSRRIENDGDLRFEVHWRVEDRARMDNVVVRYRKYDVR